MIFLSEELCLDIFTIILASQVIMRKRFFVHGYGQATGMREKMG